MSRGIVVLWAFGPKKLFGRLRSFCRAFPREPSLGSLARDSCPSALFANLVRESYSAVREFYSARDEGTVPQDPGGSGPPGGKKGDGPNGRGKGAGERRGARGRARAFPGDGDERGGRGQCPGTENGNRPHGNGGNGGNGGRRGPFALNWAGPLFLLPLAIFFIYVTVRGQKSARKKGERNGKP
jgi:hypothetical protein